MISQFVGSSPTLSSATFSTEPALDPLSPSLSAPPMFSFLKTRTKTKTKQPKTPKTLKNSWWEKKNSENEVCFCFCFRKLNNLKSSVLKVPNGDCWVVQSVKCLTLDLSSGLDLKVLSLGPVSGFVLGSTLGVEPT